MFFAGPFFGGAALDEGNGGEGEEAVELGGGVGFGHEAEALGGEFAGDFAAVVGGAFGGGEESGGAVEVGGAVEGGDGVGDGGVGEAVQGEESIFRPQTLTRPRSGATLPQGGGDKRSGTE